MARVRSVDLGNVFLDTLDGACELVLVRHGEQELRADKSLGDNRDAPLSELGRRQANAVGQRLAALDIAAVHSSPMQRARDTGQAIAAHHDLQVTLHDSIEEVDIWRGLDQDLTMVEANGGEEALVAVLREANRTSRWDAYPHGEDRLAFRERVVTTIEAIAAAHTGERIVVACHGGVINAYLAHVWGSELDNVCTVHHTSITTVRAMDDLRRVVQVNDHEHVKSFQSELNPLNSA